MSWQLGKANYVQSFFFWSTFVCCVLRLFQIKVSGWIAASILKSERYCLRHYMDATMPLAPLGKAQHYCSIFNFQLAFRGLFLQFAITLPKNADWLGASIGNAQYKGGEKNIDLIVAFHQSGRAMLIHFALLGAETEIRKIKDDGKIERETNLDRRGLRQIGTVWRIPDPPAFSLPTTFKRKKIRALTRAGQPMASESSLFLLAPPPPSLARGPFRRIYILEIQGSMPERPERGGPCWRLKMGWMGTQRVQMKGALPWLVCWDHCAGTRDFYPALAALVSPAQNIIFLTIYYLNLCAPIA